MVCFTSSTFYDLKKKLMEEKEMSKGSLSVHEAHEGCAIEIGSLLCTATCASAYD